MVEVRKREKESTGSLLRRFTRKVQQSKILISARAAARRERAKSKTKKKKDALRKIASRRAYDRLKKLGKAS